jgi:autotransporter-associated beta strand protein
MSNGVPTFTTAGDSINNVQNIYINPANVPITFPLTVTISGTRVNVNAVTTQTNNILQDYALVISSDDPALTSPLTITTNALASTNAPLITFASNGVPLLHQRVGANEPNLYNFTSGQTNGNLAQWHFFIFSNIIVTVSNTTNVAFATFLPPDLSIPRATGQADIDMYVLPEMTEIPNFTNYIANPANFATFTENAVKSVGRTGTESVIFTNATYPVYYIGIKSEDQQASDFGFYGIAQSNAFSSASADGNTITATGTSLPVFIPNSLSPVPALAFAFMVNPNPALQYIRRVVVTDGASFGTPGSLYGTLQHNSLNTVLNNYSATTSNPGFTNTYDDLQESPNAGYFTADGPGSLTQYVNQPADGLWLLAQANSDQAQTGYITTYTVAIDLQQPQTVGFIVTIPGQSWFDDYIQVPNDATNMTIFALYESQTGGPIGIFETNEIGEIFTSDYGTTNPILAPGGSLSLGTNSPVPGWPAGTPPLAGGYWYYGIYNYGTDPVTLFVQIQIEESLTPNLVTTYTNTDFIPLTTDGHTQSQICVDNGQQLVDLQVGLRLDDTNLDDLVIHLTSPQGTSVLLFENRGGTNSTNLGLSQISTNISFNGTNYSTNYLTNFIYTVFTEDTNLASVPIKFAPPPYATNIIVSNVTLYSNSFETNIAGIYTNGAILGGWLVTNNYTPIMTTNGVGVLTNYEVGIVSDSNGDLIAGTNLLGTNYLALTSARIIQTFASTNSTNVTFAPITNGQPYQLVFYAKPLGITHWWPGNGSAADVIGTNNGTISNIVVTNFYTNGAIVSSNIETTPLLNYGVGEVSQAFDFTGVGTSPTNEVDFGTNVGNFGTNDFTVDFWIQEPSGPPVTYGVMEKRTACDYNTNMWTITSANGLLSFEISGDTNLYDTILTPTNIVADGQFHHAAITRQGTMLSFYIDGLLATNYATNIVNITNTNTFRAGQTVCVGAGVQPFLGELDELDLYDRALSPAEVFAIYHAGSLGKATTNSLLPNFSLTLDNIATNTIIFTNGSSDWQLFTNSFIATNNSVTVEFAGNPMGVLIDQIQLIQLPTTNYDNYYLPEEPISPFVGENPLGCWTLDVWDTRTDSPLPTNGTLLSWTLQMTTSSTNATLYVLTNGEPITITNLNTNSIAYFAIDVPFYATYATNLLTALANGPLTLYFDQSALPTGGLPGDVTLESGVVPASGTTIETLATLGNPPPLLPGRRYFLGVENNGSSPADFKLEVDFNGGTNLIIPLTNQMPYTNIVGTNLLGTNDPEYYSFTVPTNVVLVTFQILNATNGEVDLYARQGLPVPGPLMFDYESVNAGSNDQFIAVTTNSIPVPLQEVNSTNLLVKPVPTTWYLAAYNPAGVSNIQYTIVASYVTNGFLNIIPLTNAIPYTNTASPGYPTNLMYSFTVTNSPSGIIFTVTNLTNTGNVQLLADLDGIPTPQQSYAGSLNPGTNSQFIEVIPNENLPSLNGTWYLVVPNTSISNVPYTIEAITNIGPPNVALTWKGTFSPTWDILTTSNWVETTNTGSNYVFQNGAQVTFDDISTVTTITVNEMVAPASETFNNSLFNYTFVGTGGISGGPLTIENVGSVILDTAGPDSFSSVSLGSSGATLQIGNNDTKGSLNTPSVDTGTEVNSTPGNLVFDRADAVAFSGVISDSGNVAQAGSGILTLLATNTYGGSTTISDGTLIVANTNSIGNGTVVNIAEGTLDFGGLPISYGPTNSLFDGKVFYIAGAGIGGEGAIVNDGTNAQLAGIETVFLDDNVSIGGKSRWDFNPDLISGNFPNIVLNGYTLTKTGNNQINVQDASINEGNIVIQQGILSFQDFLNFYGGLGTIAVSPGALLGQNLIQSGNFIVPTILDGGGITNMSAGGDTFFDAPIDMQNNSFIGNGGGYDYFDGIISGAGAITNMGLGTNLFSATNTYTGATYVEQGTLGFTNGGSITNSASIVVYPGATLDSTENTNMAETLILGTNQTLIDNGTVLGAAVVGFGGVTVYGDGLIETNLYMFINSVMSPGRDGVTIGTLTVAGTASLGGSNVMKINKLLSPSQTNDMLIASNVAAGGILVVTNYGSTNSFVAGDSFTLFSSPSLMGLSFSSIVLPPLTNGLYWQNNFASGGGTIYISTNSAPPPAAAHLAITLSGNQLVLNGTFGTPGSQYEVLTSTNLSLPFSNWTSITTNIFDASGDFSFTNPSPTNASQFFMIQSP